MTEATSLYDWIAPTSMFTLMFGMGLSLSLADFRGCSCGPAEPSWERCFSLS